MTKQDQLNYHMMQAYWWMHSASNGHASTRNITKGDGRKLTVKELRNDAMGISKSHIELFAMVSENWKE